MTHCRLKKDGTLSDIIFYSIGVNQGGNASGFLFRKYMSDLSKYLHVHYGVIIGDIILAHLLWADDLILISDSIEGIKKQLKGLKTFCAENHMCINEIKTKLMCFGETGDVDIVFNDRRIEQVKQYKYLGCIIQAIQPL